MYTLVYIYIYTYSPNLHKKGKKISNIEPCNGIYTEGNYFPHATIFVCCLLKKGKNCLSPAFFFSTSVQIGGQCGV